MKNLTELELQIIHCNTRYRDGQPEISDQEYDLLVERLKKQQPDSILLKKAIIEKAKESRKIKLPFPMMSLEKEKTLESVIKWAKEITLGENLIDSPLMVITPKLDGISIYQENGLFITRGDGEIGQDCSQHLQYLEKTMRPISGELIITNGTWKSDGIFRNYKHPRNTVSGWINGDYDETIPYHYMTFMAYKMFNTYKSKVEQLDVLNNNYNAISMPYVTVPLSLLSHEILEGVFEAWKIFFPIDGVVIEFNDSKYRTGTFPNGNPRFAIAYKHSSFSEIAETTIKDIELAVNRYGVVTPTILFETVNISGAELSRANGINMSYIYDWGLLPGETIKIIRSGEVIPKIISVQGVEIPFVENFETLREYNKAYELAKIQRQGKGILDFLIPTFGDEYCICPFCETTLQWDDNFTNQICPNENCQERKFQGIVDFFRIVEVENIAEGTLRSLFDKGFNTLKKIFEVTKEELLQIDGFADKSASDFIKAIKDLKHNGVSMAKYLHASGCFPNIGEKTLQLILDNWKAGSIVNTEELIKINGIGSKTANAFIIGLSKFDNLESLGVNITHRETQKKEKKEGIFSGNTFCFTGCRPTEEIKQRLENAGAEIVENFTSKVTYLVTKDMNSTSAKIEKARKSGVIIVPLADLMKNQ